MGKVAMLMVIASTIVMIGVSTSRIDAEIKLEQAQTEYTEKVLAREAATTFFNILTNASIKDFDGYRTENVDIMYGDALLSFSAVTNATDEVGLAATAYVGNASHSVSGIVVRTGESLLDAVTIDGPIKTARGDGNKYLITGYDTEPLGEIGSGGNSPTFGMRVTLGESAATILDELDGSQITGKYGNNSIVTGASPVDLDQLRTDILSYPYAVVYNEDLKMRGNDVFGSPDSPGVLIVNGKFEMEGNAVGYGVVLVNGELKMKGTSRWEGLVYAINDDRPKTELKEASSVYGALVMRTLSGTGSSTEDLGLPGGHFDVDVFNGPNTNEIYHEHQYDDKYDRTFIDLLSAGCKTNGGLCWADVIGGGGFTNVRVTVSSPEMSSGILTFDTDSWSAPAGQSPAEGLDRVFNVNELNVFRVTFDDLCAMRGTQPSNVQNDSGNRDGAFSIRIYDEESAGKPLIYELSVYHHIPKDYAGCGDGEGDIETVDVNYGKPLEFRISGDANVVYSSTALMRLPGLLPSLEVEDEVIVLEGVRDVAGQRVRLANGEYSTDRIYTTYENHSSTGTGQ